MLRRYNISGRANGRTARPQISAPFSVPAPIGGINTQDSIYAMPATDALSLKNVVCEPSGCKIRYGRKLQSHNASSTMKTIFRHPYSNKLYAISGTGLYDITSGVNIGSATPVVNNLNGDMWHVVPFATSAGSYVVAVSEHSSDEPLVIDSSGTVTRLTRASVDGSPSTWEIGYVDPEKFNHVTIHQRRLWFVEENSGSGWYLAPASISGEAKEFNFGPLFGVDGGDLYAMGTWTSDQGAGPDDYFVALSEEGDMAVYAGTDPGSASTWSLSGVFSTGRIANRRCFVNVGGDLVLLTSEGLVPITDHLLTGQTPSATAQTFNIGARKIKSWITDAVKRNPGGDGWDLEYFEQSNLLLVNCPALSTVTVSNVAKLESDLIGEDNETYQLVMNTITGGWSEWSKLGALGWCKHQGLPHFTDGVSVYSLGSQYYDDNQTSGGSTSELTVTALPAFSDMNAPGQQKYVGLGKLTLLIRVTISLSLGLRTDYSFDTNTTPAYTSGQQGSLWDSGQWGGAVWSGGQSTKQDWISMGGVGFVHAPTVTIVSESEVLWASTELVQFKGAIL